MKRSLPPYSLSMVKQTDAFIDTVGRILSARSKKSIDDDSLKPAAVLVLIYPKDGDHYVVLNKRSQAVEHHKGEISFPGGARDPEDKDFLETALRETHEEMGVDPSDVTVLGELDDVVTISKYGVRVFVGTVPYPYPFIASRREIDELIEVPIRHLLDPTYQREEVRWLDGIPTKTYSYVYDDHIVFGATARIVQQFLEMLPQGLGVMASVKAEVTR